MVISNMTLVKIGAIGGIATVTMGLALRNKLNSKVKETEHYKEALKTLRTNKGAVYLLGEPIKDGTIDVANGEINDTKENQARLQVPVKGTKQSGVLHYWAKRNDGNEWRVHRIELGLNNEPHRRLLIKDLDSKT